LIVPPRWAFVTLRSIIVTCRSSAATVVDEHGARMARFDNRAESVPRDLMSLATEILRLTGGAE
jgi:hypothetical protein